MTKIDKAKRELKALRRHPTESSRGKPRVRFITGKEQMIEVAEAAKQLNTLKKQNMRFGLNCSQATTNLAYVRTKTCAVAQQCSVLFNPPL